MVKSPKTFQFLIYAETIFLITTLLFSACKQSPKDDPNLSLPQLIQRYNQSLKPGENRFNNRLNLQAFSDSTNQKNAKTQFKKAKEHLRLGEGKTAIRILENIREHKPGYKKTKVLDLLAQSYLRLGEQINCVENHSKESCIYPIQGEGIYKFQDPTRTAISLFEELHKENPDKKLYQWLINLAWNTLGQPENIQKDLKLNLPENAPFPKFIDIGLETGTNDVGLSGGVCMDDFNNDGWLDLIVSSYDKTHGQLRYFVNNQNGSFIDHTEKSGLIGQLGGLNIIHADYNNDGWLDVLVLRGAWLKNAGQIPNSLLRNNGDNTFTDVTREAGILEFAPTQTAAWVDINKDGHLDLFIGNESKFFSNYKHSFYLNQANGTFKNVIDKTGINPHTYCKAAIWIDFNNDNKQDLYLSSQLNPNELYENLGLDKNQIPTFREVSIKHGIPAPKSSFPVMTFDYNNDNWQDLFVGYYEFDMEPDLISEFQNKAFSKERYPRLYCNQQNSYFSNCEIPAGLDVSLMAMGLNFGDLDYDGWLDFYIGTGAPDFRYLFPNRMFRNVNGQHFEEVTFTGGFGHLQKGHGIAFGDFDHDFDQDVYAVMGGAYEGDFFPNVFFENPGFKNKVIHLHLRGTKSDHFALGARIKACFTENSKPRCVYRTIGTGGSFGANPLREEIGIGQANQIDSLIVTWPATDLQQTALNLPANHSITITEEKPKPQINPIPQITSGKGGEEEMK